MKDRQLQSDAGNARIPLISDALHCISMTALVYLRSSFGYLYFRPKSVFFAFAWAQMLFSIYAWCEPHAWLKYQAEVIFGIGAIGLYLIHFALSVSSQIQRTAERDAYSGTSHLLRFFPKKEQASKPSAELTVHLWLEPACVFFAAAALRFAFSERHLSMWLFLTAFALWCKEAINYWQHIRFHKRQEDVFAEAEDALDNNPGTASPPAPNPSPDARKAKVKRARNRKDDADERRFAEVLRMMPPYTLAQAEENFRTLIKDSHPDTHDSSPESTTRSTELNAAILHLFPLDTVPMLVDSMANQVAAI